MNGIVSIPAASNAAARKGKSSTYQVTPSTSQQNLSSTSSVTEPFSGDPAQMRKNEALVAYKFYSQTAEKLTLSIVTLPTHPLNNSTTCTIASV
jgi:hypothetical protein